MQVKAKILLAIVLALLVAGCQAVSVHEDQATPTVQPATTQPTSTPERDPGQAPQAPTATPNPGTSFSPDAVIIEQVQVDTDQVVVSGRSKLADGTCILTELLADGNAQEWWPTDACAQVEGGVWQIVVPLGLGNAPEPLDSTKMYEVQARQEEALEPQARFPFDLAGPPLPAPTQEVAYQNINIEQVGLSIEIPANWTQLAPEWAWTPDEAGQLRIGVNWIDLEPPMIPEAVMLPNHAQTLDSQPVDLGWGQGRWFLVEVYAPAAQGNDTKAPVETIELHTLVVAEQEGVRRAFDLYASAPSTEAMQDLRPLLQHMLDTSTLNSAPSESTDRPAAQVPDEWQVFRDEEYRLQFRYPQDWTYRELDAQGPGAPDDWPVVRILQFYPQAWAEEIERSGPPDPANPAPVAPLFVEICVGPVEQYRRAYPEPTRSEVRENDGTVVTIEEDVLNDRLTQYRYVFQDTDRADVRIVFTDLITGFPDRAIGNQNILQAIPLVVNTMEFTAE